MYMWGGGKRKKSPHHPSKTKIALLDHFFVIWLGLLKLKKVNISKSFYLFKVVFCYELRQTQKVNMQKVFKTQWQNFRHCHHNRSQSSNGGKSHWCPNYSKCHIPHSNCWPGPVCKSVCRSNHCSISRIGPRVSNNRLAYQKTCQKMRSNHCSIHGQLTDLRPDCNRTRYENQNCKNYQEPSTCSAGRNLIGRKTTLQNRYLCQPVCSVLPLHSIKNFTHRKQKWGGNASCLPRNSALLKISVMY